MNFACTVGQRSDLFLLGSPKKNLLEIGMANKNAWKLS